MVYVYCVCVCVLGMCMYIVYVYGVCVLGMCMYIVYVYVYCVCVWCMCAHTASTLAAVGRSCLFAKISTGTPFSFSSSRRLPSSSAVSSKRFVSVLSMM